VRIALLILITTLLGTQALAQPVEIASGADLDAWQVLEQRRLLGPQAVVEYQAYVLQFSASPLAVMAWDRLVDAGGVDGAWTQAVAVRGVVAQVRRQWEHHQRILQEETATASQAVTVESVDEVADPSAEAVTSR
jgi:hypothetical protein